MSIGNGSSPSSPRFKSRSSGRRATDKSAEEFQSLIEEVKINQLETEHQNRELLALHHALEESHSRYVDLYEFAPILYATLDSAGKVLDINLKGASRLGTSPSAIVNHLFIVFLAKEDYGTFTQHLSLCRQTPGEHTCEVTLITKEGSRVPVQVTTAYVEDRSRRRHVFQSAMTDLRERKQMEDALRQKDEELHHTRKIEAIGRLAGGVAHDFNNLLAGILGIAQDLHEGMESHDARRADLEEIIKAGNRAFALTRQLLAFGRRQIIAARPLNLNSIVGTVEAMLRRLIGEDVELTVHPQGGLTAIYANEGQIEQVLSNLVLNARDAMPRGGRVEIRTSDVLLKETPCVSSTFRPGPYVLLQVTDNGIGMDAALLSKIFEPFFSTKTKDKGTGLGLSTVYGIVKQHGGEVIVNSTPGRGTTFNLYFRSLGHLQTAPPEADAPTHTAKGTETILLVEDEEIVRKVTLKLLCKQGYSVFAVENGASALDFCRKHTGTIDLMITDVVMPGMNGNELAKQMLKIRPELAVLYISGYPEDVIAKHGILDAGVFFIEKAKILNHLNQKVRSILEAGPPKKDALPSLEE
jgi:PAS domain S-box-containing protein